MPDKLQELTQNKFTDLNEPVTPQVIGNIPVNELTPDDNQAISDDREQLLEEGMHPNLKQHPIRFLSDQRDGKLILLAVFHQDPTF